MDHQQISQIQNFSNAATQILDSDVQSYPQHILDDMAALLNKIETYENLDHSLIHVLKDLSENEDHLQCYDDIQYPDIAKNINNSYVIYFKNAGIFKVYSPEELNTLQGHLRTRPPLKNTNEIYEIVSKESPQKIIIIIDGTIENELNKIKDYVYAFFKTYNGELDRDKDVISYKNPVTNNLEILVNGIYANNYNDKKQFVEKLLSYIEVEERKKGKISLDLDKIKHHKYSEIPGADMIIIPEKRQNISTVISQILQYATTPQNYNSSNVGITINIHNNGDGIIAIGNDNNVTTKNISTAASLKKNDIQIFVDYIKSSHPSWYKEEEYVDISYLHRHFMKITKSKISCGMFSKKCKGILFGKSVVNTVDGKSVRQVMLRNIEDL